MSKLTPESHETFQTERALTAQRLAQYVARGRCERHMRFTLFPSEAREMLGRYRLEFEPLSPLLSGEGQRFEREMVEELAARDAVRDMSNTGPEAFISEVTGQGEARVCYYQPSLRGRVGGWECEGRADLIEVVREGARSRATVVDFTASARETVGFRLQVAFYARLLEATLGEVGLAPAEVRGAIVARDSSLPEDGAWETFDLSLYADEIERLVAASDSDVAHAVRAGVGRARYHLRPSCDGCPYNALCFADTAERLDLSLVPALAASEKRALEASGVTSARALASLMEYGAGVMNTTEGSEETLRRASARWPLASRLPLLVQRARAAVRRHDRTFEARRYLLGSDYGSLPDPAEHPGLVRVFVDAQRDYIEDKLYLVAARVAGPRESAEIVEMTLAPPDADSERAMLVRWLQALLPAVARAAAEQRAPLHVYTFAPRGERALLDALARHFDALCAIPAFYDLLTSSPALTQPMVSLLAEEVRARMNLAPVCQNLYETAAALGFEWKDERTDFRRLFRARVFDNHRTFVRDQATGRFKTRDEGGRMKDEVRADGGTERRGDGEIGMTTAGPLSASPHHPVTPSPRPPSSLIPPPSSLDDDAPPFVRVESAARFGAEIPLEYAYAAWGCLRETSESSERSQIRGFEGVSAQQIRDFARTRTRAMQHVEESFAYKNRRVEKEPLDLSRLGEVEVDPSEVPLRRSLEDFLLLEHHASHQERLLHLALPPRERAETGRTAVLRCESYEKTDARVERARFRFADADGVEVSDSADGEEVSVKDLGLLRLRVGDWVVLNPLADAEGRALPAWRLVRGRLAIVEEISASHVTLRLLPMSFKNSPFRYPHQLFMPDADSLYTVDEMADDLNADKFLEACRNAQHNQLYRWLSDTEEGRRPRAVRPKRLRDAH